MKWDATKKRTFVLFIFSTKIEQMFELAGANEILQIDYKVQKSIANVCRFAIM